MLFLNYKPLKLQLRVFFSRSYCCCGNLLCHKNDNRRFPFTKKFGNFLLGISVWEKRVPFVTSPVLGRPGRLIDRERHETGAKDNKSVNGTQIFHWEVSTGKTGLPFQEFHLFRKISSGTNQKVVFHLQPDRNFRNFLVNGKRSTCSPITFPPFSCWPKKCLPRLQEIADNL